jgi:hypothetical protein
VAAFRTNEHPFTFIGVFRLAFRAIWQLIQGFDSFALELGC